MEAKLCPFVDDMLDEEVEVIYGAEVSATE